MVKLAAENRLLMESIFCFSFREKISRGWRVDGKEVFVLMGRCPCSWSCDGPKSPKSGCTSHPSLLGAAAAGAGIGVQHSPAHIPCVGCIIPCRGWVLGWKSGLVVLCAPQWQWRVKSFFFFFSLGRRGAVRQVSPMGFSGCSSSWCYLLPPF